MIKNEWKSLLRNKLMLIVVIAIIVIPIIYAGLFLKSMWDPYGNVDSLPVAVVNEDKPVEYNGKTLSIGKDMADELKDNDSMAFNIVDSKTAEDGLANGTYYMVIKIPENFSANAATVMDDDPKQMELSYETNPHFAITFGITAAIPTVTAALPNRYRATLLLFLLFVG